MRELVIRSSSTIPSSRYRDTVSSVGVFPRRLPFTGSNNHISYFRHAISLDERRARFKVNLWNRRTDREHNLGVQKGTMPRHKTPPKMGDNGNSLESSISTKSALKREYSEPDRDKPTDTEEVWFSGCHGGEFKSTAVCHLWYHLMLAPHKISVVGVLTTTPATALPASLYAGCSVSASRCELASSSTNTCSRTSA